MEYDIFISYRRSDIPEFAQQLLEALERDEHSTFLDQQEIGPGKQWPEDLQRRLEESKILLVVVGNNWEEDRLQDPEDWVRKEIATVLGDENKRVLPVLVDRDQLPSEDSLPEDIQSLASCQGVLVTNSFKGLQEVASKVEEIMIELAYGEDIRKLHQYYSGRYQFENILSKSHRAHIYKAQDTRLKREVIFRVLQSENSNGKSDSIIQQAIQFAESFKNSVPVYDADHKSPSHVIMGYMEGGSLRSVLKSSQKGLDYARVADILKSIGESLMKAESAHCNIKPSNILLSRGGIAYLNPLNRIRQLNPEKIIEKLVGQINGEDNHEHHSYQEDLRYLAPEIFDINYKTFSEEEESKIDQYMLGLLGYELLEGQKPNTYQHIKELTELSGKQLWERLGKVERCANEKLKDVLHKMVHYKPEKRYDNLKDAIDAINKAVIAPLTIDIVRKSYLRCLNNLNYDKPFLEAFYERFLAHPAIKAIFDRFLDPDNPTDGLRRQYNHLQGAIYGLIEFAEVSNRLTKAGIKPKNVRILDHVADRHSYDIGVNNEHFEIFQKALLETICGDPETGKGAYDPRCHKPDNERERTRIEEAWLLILEPGLEYMVTYKVYHGRK